jgi:23S rRNA pseudouridine1911/1915/1917 synthase
VVDSAEALHFTVTEEDSGKRLDTFLAERIEGWSRSRLQSAIANEDVTVGGRTAKASYKIRPGDEIDVELPTPADERFEPENIPLDVCYEDEYLAVINKPAGMIVHPGAGVSGGTLANAIAYHFGLKSDGMTPGVNRVGIVHRLDKDTSGLIVVAKDEATHEWLAAQFRMRRVVKRYVALVHGSTRENSGEIDRPIARDRRNRTRMTVSADGRRAITIWRVRRRFVKFTLLDVDIRTGRTHQIRVHLSSIHHPVVGDAVYNEGRDKTISNPEIRKAVARLGRFFLHSEYLAFRHPKTRETVEFSASLPSELVDLLDVIEQNELA